MEFHYPSPWIMKSKLPCSPHPSVAAPTSCLRAPKAPVDLQEGVIQVSDMAQTTPPVICASSCHQNDAPQMMPVRWVDKVSTKLISPEKRTSDNEHLHNLLI